VTAVLEVGVDVVVQDASIRAVTIKKLRIADKPAFVTFSSLLVYYFCGHPV